MVKKKDKEEVVEVEAELTAGVALAQAGNVLITAADKAEAMSDVDALMKIAGGWMEIHEYLTGNTHGENKKLSLGFTNAHTQEVEEEDLDDAIAAEDRIRSSTKGKRIRRVY
jgi:hypothetical protein